MKKLLSIFNNRYLFITLLLLNIAVSVKIFLHFRSGLGGDFTTYWGLSEGLHHGRYSFWWFYPQYLPDTFRNPGYAAFIFLLTSICNKVLFVQALQLLLYFLTISLALKILNKFDSKGFSIKNLFLLILLPNLQIAASTPEIMPDSLSAFFVMLLVYADEKMEGDKWAKYIIMGLLCGIIFQLRPVFLLFPFVKIIIDFLFQRRTFAFLKYSVLALIFILTTLPYGIWNYKNNGVFKITSIEGGGGVLQNAYWNFKLPNYIETHYWYGNKVAEEMIPFSKKQDIEKNTQAYDKEWYMINSACARYETRYDTLLEAQMLRDDGLIVHNPIYSLKRDELLRDITFKHFMAEPLYFIETRIYTAFRIWVPGIQFSEFKSKSMGGKIALVYPFIVSIFTFFATLIFVSFCFWRRKINVKDCVNLILPVIYVGLIYVPFGIQSRYSIPGRMLLFMLLAISIVKAFENKKEIN